MQKMNELNEQGKKLKILRVLKILEGELFSFPPENVSYSLLVSYDENKKHETTF